MNLSIENMRIEKEYEHNCVGKYKLKEEVVRSGKFKTGVNFLVGEIDDVTWPFVYTIARGKSYKNNAEVHINGKESSFSDFQKSTYYVAYWEDKFPYNFLRTTLKQHLVRNLKKNKTKYTFDEIVQLFKLRKRHFNNRILATSGNRWYYSFAIGFAKGKKVFCFPWLSESVLKSQTYRFSILADIAKKEDLVILIPVENDYAFCNGKSRLVYEIVDLY